MDVPQDFKELLRLFNEHNVEYMIVGGYALAFHGAPRYTGDIDIFIKPDVENASQILMALNKFGFGSIDLKREDFITPDQVVQLGFPPVRIDIITSISGTSWDDAVKKHAKGFFDDIPVCFIGREHYIINKKASGRKKDLADLEALGED